MSKSYDNFIKLAIKTLPKSSADFGQLKKDICKKIGGFPPTNADLRDCYDQMLSARKIKQSVKLEKLLKSRGIRTESGVAVIAVLTKSYPCPGKCLYCPTEKDMPKSYLSNEPAVMRAIKVKFDPYNQVQTRIKSLELNGHNTDKIELIVMGGTFSYLPDSYQKRFIYECFRACNEYGKKFKVQNLKLKVKEKLLDKYLLNEQKKNEKAKHRIVGLTLETRPDYIDEKEILNFRNLGCTRVELGVQSIFDAVLKKNKRGHGIEATIEASKLLKDAGFKINYHIMPGLFGSDTKKDYLMFKELFTNPNFQPDMLKIYPTVVTKNSVLYRLWKNGKYKPLSDKQFEKLILKVKKEIIPPYVRIARLVRDIPGTSIIAGPKISNLRQLIEKESACKCIRCREVRNNYEIKDLPALPQSTATLRIAMQADEALQAGKIILDRIDYDASDGKEIFLQYVSKDKKKLFALLRLRIPSDFYHSCKSRNLHKQSTGFLIKSGMADIFPALKNSAIIREVHTYGKLTKINKKDKTSPQHIGLGKKLIEEAEKITKKELGSDRISVISGVGVRNYYRKLGYKLQNTYMIKSL